MAGGWNTIQAQRDMLELLGFESTAKIVDTAHEHLLEARELATSGDLVDQRESAALVTAHAQLAVGWLELAKYVRDVG